MFLLTLWLIVFDVLSDGKSSTASFHPAQITRKDFATRSEIFGQLCIVINSSKIEIFHAYSSSFGNTDVNITIPLNRGLPGSFKQKHCIFKRTHRIVKIILLR